MSKTTFTEITITGRPDAERSTEEKGMSYYAFRLSNEPPCDWLDLFKAAYSHKPSSCSVLSEPPAGASMKLKMLFESPFKSPILMLCCPSGDKLQLHYKRLKETLKAVNRSHTRTLKARAKATDAARQKQDTELKASEKRISSQIKGLKL
jgi:hypothetical protein